MLLGYLTPGHKILLPSKLNAESGYEFICTIRTGRIGRYSYSLAIQASWGRAKKQHSVLHGGHYCSGEALWGNTQSLGFCFFPPPRISWSRRMGNSKEVWASYKIKAVPFSFPPGNVLFAAWILLISVSQLNLSIYHYDSKTEQITLQFWYSYCRADIYDGKQEPIRVFS